MKTAPGILVMILLCCGFQAHADTGRGASIARTDALVKAVDSTIAGYRKAERDLNGLSTGGSTVTSYSKGARIDKIGMVTYGEAGRAFHDFYYRGGKVVCMRHRVVSYEGITTHSLHGEDGLRERMTTDFRLYFLNDELVLWNTRIGASPGGEVRAAALQSFLDTAYSMLALMRREPGSGPCQGGWECTEKSGGRCTKYRCAGPQGSEHGD
jgi:hypothetical protein